MLAHMKKTVECYALPIYNCYVYWLRMVKAILSHASELPIRFNHTLLICFNHTCHMKKK